MPNDCISADTYSDFAAKDSNRILGRIAKNIARKSPFIDLLPGGVFPANYSQVVRSVVQEEAALGTSLAKPVFANSVDVCGTIGNQDNVGSIEYQYQLQNLRGRGPRVCLRAARNAFKTAYDMAYGSLESGLRKITNSDIRSLLHLRSGLKYVCRSSAYHTSNITGSEFAIDTKFAAVLPTAPLNFKTLRKLGGLLKQDYGLDPFETDRGAMFKVIGSDDAIEYLRNDTQVRSDVVPLTQGSFKIGEDMIKGFEFEQLYRGYAFGVDPQPIRASGFDGSGNLVLVEPQVAVSTSNGTAFRVNPSWVSTATAPYELVFLLAGGSFERLTPERFVGEGDFKFSPQLVPGSLEWFFIRDNCNAFGDYGQHIYEIERAYRPIRPHAVIAILTKRCDFDHGLSACATTSSGL